MKTTRPPARRAGHGPDHCGSRSVRRGAVPGKLRRHGAVDGDVAARRPGDESRRQGQTGRRAGGSGSTRSKQRADGQAAIHLAIDPTQLSQIPDNVIVDIASTTVFGAKSIELVPPPNPSPRTLRPGPDTRRRTRHRRVQHHLRAAHLGAVHDSAGEAQRNTRRHLLRGRRSRTPARPDAERLRRTAGQVRTEPAQPEHDSEIAPVVLNAYADAAPDLLTTLDNTTQHRPDRRRRAEATSTHSSSARSDSPTSATTSWEPTVKGLTDLLHVLVPTTDLTNQYNRA